MFLFEQQSLQYKAHEILPSFSYKFSKIITYDIVIKNFRGKV